MKNKALIPIIIVAGIAILYFMGKSRLMKLKVLFRGFKVTGKLWAPKFNLKFALQNPTSETANLQSLVGEVVANNKIIANVSNFNTVKILPNNETALNIVAEPVGLTIAKTVMDFIKTNNKLIIEFKGSATIDNIVYPINSVYNI